MKGKRVGFSFPPIVNIRDYSLGYRLTIPYSPQLCLNSIKRFRNIQSQSCKILTNEYSPIFTNIPLSKQGIYEGDSIHIVPIH
jgi:hypothetical protein